jgi:hypothetical protein
MKATDEQHPLDKLQRDIPPELVLECPNCGDWPHEPFIPSMDPRTLYWRCPLCHHTTKSEPVSSWTGTD